MRTIGFVSLIFCALCTGHKSRNTVHGYIFAVAIERHVNHLRTKSYPLNLKTQVEPRSKYLRPRFKSQ